MDRMMILGISIMIASGGVLTFYLNHKLGKGPVFASAIVAFFSGIIFPYLFGDWGLTMAAAITAGSYAGMSGKDRIQNYVDMLVVSVFLSILYIISKDVFVGIGGKLGTIACISVISVYGMKVFPEMIVNKGDNKLRDLNTNNRRGR